MPEWFQTKVKFLRQMDNGLIKRVAEQYLVDAVSFTEAEARIMMEVADNQREITMVSITKSNIREVVFYGDTDLWYKAKVTYVVADEETEKEKKVTTYLLVNAGDVRETYDRVQEHLKEMLVPFQIPKIEETQIVEVYQYQQGFRAGMRRATEDDYPDEETEEGSLPHIQPSGDFEGEFRVQGQEEE